MMRFLARFLAVVLAAAFVVATVAVVFVRPFGTRLLAPQAYKDVLREKQVEVIEAFKRRYLGISQQDALFGDQFLQGG